MRVMLTGCQGQVGCYLTQLIKQKEWTLLALGRADLDIAIAEDVTAVVQSFKPDVIINAAAYTAVDRAESEPELAYQVNADGPANLAKAAEQQGAALLHISTDYVFAGDKQGPYVELDPVSPAGVYGATKLAGEQYVAKACSRHIILRTAWVFGEHGGNFVKTMLRLGRERDQLGVVGDQVGGPTFAGDIAHTLTEIASQIESGKEIAWGVYHYSGLPHVSWYQFAQTIFEAAEKQGVLESQPNLKAIGTSDYPTPAKRPANSRLDCSKLGNEFGIEPSDWNSALQCIQHYG